MADYWNMSLDELIALRRRKATTANKQIQRWRAAGLENKGAAYKQYAKPYLRQFGPDRETFHVGTRPIAKAKASDYQKRRKEIAELSALDRYMQASTYKISGYKKAKERALQGLAQAAGIEPGSEEMTRFLASAAEDIVGSDQWNWVKWTLGSEAIKAVARGIAQGTSTKAEVLEKIKAMQVKELAGEEYSELTWEDYLDELGLDEQHESEGN